MNEVEIWKAVHGFEGLYEVSNQGRVKSLGRTNKASFKILKGSLYQVGYSYHHLRNKTTSQKIKVHRLVAMSFIPNPYNKPQVNHIDGNKLNNNVSNLEWATSKENVIHAHKNGLSSVSHLVSLSRERKLSKCRHAKKVNQFSLSGDLLKTWDCILSAAIALGNPNRAASIVAVCKGKQKTAFSFNWRYENNQL